VIKLNKYSIPYIFILILIGFRGEILVSFLVVLLHELVHYEFARYFGCSGFDIEILPIGAVINLKELDEVTPTEDLIISLSGPLMNLILAVFFYFLKLKYQNTFNTLFFEGNLAVGVFNLIPAFPLDGGRIFRDIASKRYIFKKANKISIITSIILGIILMLLFIYLFLVGKNDFNLGIIALLIIISSLKENERIVYIIMGDIIKKKYKFLNRGYIENKSISVYYKYNLLEVLSLVDKNKYNMFTVLDEEMRLMDIIYEDEVLEALKNYGNISIKEFLKNENKL
jgi:stage IV sporulation protein FB